MVRVKIKCLAMLLMGIAVYLTMIYVNLENFTYFFLGSAPLTCALTLCIYAGAFSLLFAIYVDQISRQTSVIRVLNNMALLFLVMFIWFTCINLIQLSPQTIIEGVYAIYYWPIDFFPNIHSTQYIAATSAILTATCFIVNWKYKHIKTTQQQHIQTT